MLTTTAPRAISSSTSSTLGVANVTDSDWADTLHAVPDERARKTTVDRTRADPDGAHRPLTQTGDHGAREVVREVERARRVLEQAATPDDHRIDAAQRARQRDQ